MSTVGVNATALAGLVIVIWVIVYAVLVAGFRIWRDDGRLRLAEMLRRQGSTPQQAFDLCVESFCPNADFIARVTAR